MNTRDTLYPYADGSKYEGKNASEVFQDIYRSSTWNIKTHDSVSGEGSNAEQTQTLRMELPALLTKLEVKSLLDIPCGDFHWMQQVDMKEIAYTGADIVPEIVAQNNKQYASSKRRFIQADLLSDLLPAADLIFCRDCLVHLSFADVQAALQNIRATQATYLMTTHFPDEPQNKDIVTGGWRPLNFCLPPFNFPEPLYLLNENCTEMDGAFRDKSMAVWCISAL